MPTARKKSRTGGHKARARTARTPVRPKAVQKQPAARPAAARPQPKGKAKPAAQPAAPPAPAGKGAAPSGKGTAATRPLAPGEAAPKPKPAPAFSLVGTAGGVWAALRQCESGGNYQENTGNGFYGAYQFAASTWTSMGYPGRPDQEPPAMQDQAAQRLQARSGWGQWPACSRKLGLS